VKGSVVHYPVGVWIVLILINIYSPHRLFSRLARHSRWAPWLSSPAKHVFCFTPWREQIFRQREWNSNSRIFCSRLSIGLDLRSGTPDLSTFRAEKCTPERGKSTHVFCSCWHLLKKDEVTQAEDEWLCQLIVLCLDSMPREFLGFEIPLQTYLRLLSLVIIY